MSLKKVATRVRGTTIYLSIDNAGFQKTARLERRQTTQPYHEVDSTHKNNRFEDIRIASLGNHLDFYMRRELEIRPLVCGHKSWGKLSKTAALSPIEHNT